MVILLSLLWSLPPYIPRNSPVSFTVHSQICRVCLCDFYLFNLIYPQFQVCRHILEFNLNSVYFRNSENICICSKKLFDNVTYILGFLQDNCWFMQKGKKIQFRRLHSWVYFVTGLATNVENNILFYVSVHFMDGDLFHFSSCCQDSCYLKSLVAGPILLCVAPGRLVKYTRGPPGILPQLLPTIAMFRYIAIVQRYTAKILPCFYSLFIF